MHTLVAPMEQLERLLCPQGIKTVTTGADEVGRYMKLAWGSANAREARAVWRKRLDAIVTARVVIIGVPMDAGAGFERGSFKGPLGLRTHWLGDERIVSSFEQFNIVDLGDVRVNPHLIDDGMLTPALIEQVRKDRGWAELTHLNLPVAPHSILERVLELIHVLNEDVKVLVLGGDHSISRVPVLVQVCGERNPAQDFGVLHFDAHTDLLSIRDGVHKNFATWAYHTNLMLGQGGRLQQVGVRTSGFDKTYWEKTLEVGQFWSDEVVANPQGVMEQVIANFESAGVRRVYISNDIDATDPRFAASTGTMELGGLSPQFVRELIRMVGARFDVVGSDLVEVAPPLKWHIHGEPARTIQTGVGYVLEQLGVMLGEDMLVSVDVPKPADEAQVLAMPSWT